MTASLLLASTLCGGTSLVQRVPDPSLENLLQQERQIRDLVMRVARASGAGVRGETFRQVREDELIGRFWEVDNSSPRFSMLSFNHIIGVVRKEGTVNYSRSSSWLELPKDARRWTEEECEGAVRRSFRALLPPELSVGRVEMRRWGPDAYAAIVRIVVTADPRVNVRAPNLIVDANIGMPRTAELPTTWAKVVPERAVARISEAECVAEAERVYRQVAPFPLARCVGGGYGYSIPNFEAPGLDWGVNEMTETHRDLARRRERTVMYSWNVENVADPRRHQGVVVDALTGRALFCGPPLAEMLELGGSPAPVAPAPIADAVWTLGKASGQLRPVSEPPSGGATHILKNGRGELLLVRLDSKRGVLEAGGKVYRPDVALLKALRSEGTVRAFGTKPGEVRR